MDVDRLLLVSKFKKNSILAKYIGTFFSIVKTKSSLSTFFLSFYHFPNLKNKILCILDTNM